MSKERKKEWDFISTNLINHSRYFGFQTYLEVNVSESVSIPIVISPFLVYQKTDFLYWSKDSI